MHSASHEVMLSSGSCQSYQPKDDSFPNSTSGLVSSTYDMDSPLPSSSNTTRIHDEALPSSTPDLLSPTVTSSDCSPDVPLTQEAFNKHLHARLQTILDQQYDERGSGLDDSVSQDAWEDEWITVSRGEEHDVQLEKKCVSGPVTCDDYSNASDTSSTDSLGVWAASPDASLYLDRIHRETPLTHRNKRKHDQSRGVLEAHEWDGDTTDVEHEHEDDHVPRKKVKLQTDSIDSVSSSFGYQTNETASSRKLRSLTSMSSSFTSTVSTSSISPKILLHPIIHPPVEPPEVPRSRREVAEARLKVLLKREASCRVQDGLPAGPFDLADFSSDDGKTLFGLDSKIRREVIHWIFDILPPVYLDSEDLYQHLVSSDETRFHAMYLFSRYFMRVSDCGERHRQTEADWMKRIRDELTWDTALCCLAISTKFYHDFLRPLYPIHVKDFLAISPQLLSCDQFEERQMDILEAFEYEIYGVTPHSFFEELWNAIPSLQDIMKLRRSRRIIRNEMWESLQVAALQSDIMRFPISLLTAAVLIEAVIMAFIDAYEQEADDISQVSDDCAQEDDNRRKACELVGPVSRDIVLLLETSDAELRACRRWLSLFRQ